MDCTEQSKYIGYVIEVCTGMRMAEMSRIPREIHGNGDKCRRNTTEMEIGAAGIPRGWNLFLQEPRRR